MSDLTDVKFFLASLLRPIVKEAIHEELNALHQQPIAASDTSPYGDFQWLVATCPVPPSTLRVKTSTGEIPGTVRLGKRILYEKAVVLTWLRNQTRQVAPAPEQLDRAADEQVVGQLAKRQKKGAGHV